jgi:hypothetical protein
MKAEWAQVWEKIPKCRYDAEEAIYCYALERDTAVYFHSMRVAEQGLRRLAKRLRVTLTHKGARQPIESADWNDVITGINNKIKTIRNLPRIPKREIQLDIYSDAADHCTFMKDIWRNKVSHSGKPYKPSEALSAMERVRDFMQFLTGKAKW